MHLYFNKNTEYYIEIWKSLCVQPHLFCMFLRYKLGTKHIGMQAKLFGIEDSWSSQGVITLETLLENKEFNMRLDILEKQTKD